MKKSYTDQEIIAAVQAGGRLGREMTHYLYDQFQGLVIKGQRKFRLSEEDSRDVYADAIIGLNRQISLGRFRGESKLSTYLISIFYNRCRNKVRDSLSKQQNWVSEMPDLPARARSMLEEMIERDEIRQWAERIRRLGDTCKQILWGLGVHGYSLEELAQQLGFSNTKSLSSKKYTCIQRLKALLAEEKNML